jgi:TRAP-type C4-dicarboxylate transport system substrate-binding protein
MSRMSVLRITAVLIGLIASVPAAAKDLRTSDVNPEGSATVAAIEQLGRLLRERTHGRLTVTMADAGDRDSENFTIGQVQTGAMDMARVSLAAFNSTVPATVPLSLPFLLKSTAHLRRVLDGPIGAEILASLEVRGVVGLCFYDTGARSLYSVDRLIRHVDDMKGLTIRVQPGDLAQTLVKALGATGVPLPYSRIGEALRSKAIDAADSNWPAYVRDGHYHYAKVYNETEHSRAPGVVIVSLKTWQSLSAGDQAILKQAALESVQFMRRQFDADAAQARMQALKSGVRVMEDVDVKSFADVLLPLYPGLLPTPRQRQIVDRIKAEQQAAR